MASEIKPDALCFVVRNVSGHPCIQADIGKSLTVGRREMVPELTFGPGIIGSVPAWSIKSGPERCPHCLGIRSHYLEADLQAIDGPGQCRDAPAMKPTWVGVDLAAGVKGDPTEIARRMLEALR